MTELTIIEHELEPVLTHGLAPASKFGKFELFKSNQVKRSGGLLLIYGAQGVGKTTAVGTAANSFTTAFLDYDRRTDVLSHRDDIDIFYMNTVVDGTEFFREDPSTRWRVICIDNLSELAEIELSRAERELNSKDPRQHFSLAQARIITFVKKCREYAHRTGTCIIFTAWEGAVGDVYTEGITHRYPFFSPKLAFHLLGLIPIIGYMAEDRQLFFESNRYKVKFGVAQDDVAFKMPRQFKEPDFSKILSTLLEGKPY